MDRYESAKTPRFLVVISSAKTINLGVNHFGATAKASWPHHLPNQSEIPIQNHSKSRKKYTITTVSIRQSSHLYYIIIIIGVYHKKNNNTYLFGEDPVFWGSFSLLCFDATVWSRFDQLLPHTSSSDASSVFRPTALICFSTVSNLTGGKTQKSVGVYMEIDW